MTHLRSSANWGRGLGLVLIAAAACAAGLLLLSAKSGGSSNRVLQDAYNAKASATLSPARVKELQAADKDILGNLELAKKDDPSYESVAAYLPAMKNPREVVGVRYHPHEIGIAADGTLQLSDDVDVAGAPTAFFEVGSPAVRFGSGPAGCAKSLLQGYLPIVTARFAHDGIEYKQTVVGYSDGLSPDTELWAYIDLEVKNSAPQAREAAVSLRFNPASTLNAAKTWTFKLAAGGASRLYLRVPFDVKASGWAAITEADFEAALKAVSAFWTRELNAGLTIDVPEARINDAARAWRAYAMLDVDEKNGVLEPHDGAGFYEEIYGYSAALLPHALDLWGRPDDARQILDSLLTFQRPDGLFTSHFGTPDPGALLSSLAEHYELAGDLSWLRTVAPKMIRMADWIIAKRKESMVSPGGTRSVTFGLIKFSPYCDYQTPSFDYFGDTYCAVGLEKTALALRAAGQAEEAARIGREAAAYRRDILASMDAAVMERDGFQILPMEPDTHRLLKGTNDRGGGYYGLIASCMLESEFLPADDKRAGWVMRFMEEKGGLRLGMAEFDGGVDHAYTYGYWLDSLKLDRVKETILGLYASLAHGMSRETYAGVEVTHLFTGANEPTLPHLYSCTQQLRLLRMMLVREDGPDLRLAQAVPRPWLEAGRTIDIRNAPTKFGPVSLTIESHVDRGRIDVRLTAPAREAPPSLLLRLRHPQEKPIKSVTVDGKPLTSFAGDTVTLASPRGALKIVVVYE
jgi:hypothetical protein